MKFTIKNIKGSNINSCHNDRKDATGCINPNQLKIQVLSAFNIDILNIQDSEIEIDDVITDDHRNHYSETPISWHAAKQFSDDLSNKLGRKCLSFWFIVYYKYQNENREDTWYFEKDPLPWGDVNKQWVSPYPVDISRKLSVGSRKRSKICNDDTRIP